jgi:hypothetical protein
LAKEMEVIPEIDGKTNSGMRVDGTGLKSKPKIQLAQEE